MPIQLDAKLNAFRRSTKGFYITLEISPDCDWQELAAAPLGQPFGVAMVAYDAETGKASPGADTPPLSPDAGQQRGETGKPRRPFDTLPFAQQAALLCQDDRFHQWLFGRDYRKGDPAHLTASAAWLRAECGVGSRAEIERSEQSASRFRQIRDKFRQETGQIAEQRA